MDTQKREAIVDEARAWIGTPFHHAAAVAGVGCDCGGLVIGVGHALGLLPDIDQKYGRIITPETLLSRLRTYLRSSALPPALGDVVVIYSGGGPTHCGIVSNLSPLRIIHACEFTGAVVEHRAIGMNISEAFTWPK